MSLRGMLTTAVAMVLLACDPRLPEASPGGAGGAGGGGVTEATVAVEPAAPLSAVPRALRLHVSKGGQAPALDQVLLLQGEVGKGQLRELHDGRPSAALEARQIATRVWQEGDEAVLAPTGPLEAGALYTLVDAEVPQGVALHVMTSDEAPLLARAWPPQGASGTAAFALWCGDSALPRVDAAITLSPGGARGRVRRGAVDAGAGERCLRFEADSSPPEGGMPPPLVTSAADAAMVLRLDPALLEIDAPAAPVVSLSCAEGEVPFGPGCVQVEDDRLAGRAPAAPLLWAVAGAGTDTVLATAPGDPFVLTGLPPAADITLDVAAIDARGTALRALFTAITAAARPHVVINEVLANPIGPEPAQEWVEIVNDGRAPAHLEGYVLTDSGGDTPLPAATLSPGAFALIVNGSFLAEDGVDPGPAPGTLILHVPHLGKSGLSNSGEPLVLRNETGSPVSRAPATPRPRPGRSVARRAPSAPDALASSFALATPSPGRPNTW